MNGHVLKQFGWMMPLMKSMPDWLVKILNPKLMTLIGWQKVDCYTITAQSEQRTDIRQDFRKQVIQVKKDIAAGEKPKGQTTIFYDVLTNPDVRPQEKTDDHLQDEAQTVIGAGTVTTGHILAYVSFYIINNPAIRSKLEAELSDIMSQTNGKPKWSQLEQLPYLTAVITEALRIGYGVSHRLQRLFPDTVLEYKGYAIPTMTPVSMSAVLIHDNPSLFPDPRTFNPERFIENPGLKRDLVTFSKGSRQCAGLNLAYAELYLTLAAIFAPGRANLELFETDISDVEIVHDFLNTSPRMDSKGIRVVVT